MERVALVNRRVLLASAASLSLVPTAIAARARPDPETGDGAPPVAHTQAQGTPTAPVSASPVASPAATPVAAVTVSMTVQLMFEPADVTIKVGDTITWTNVSPIPHTATCDPDKNPVKETRPEVVQLPEGAAPWDSGLLNEGQSFSQTFTVAGEYKYVCIPHVLSGMLGTITVEN